MYLTAEEQEELVHTTEVYEEGFGPRRWSETMHTVVMKAGKFYRIVWERGLTENQDSVFESGEVEEVFRSEKLVVKGTSVYHSAEELEEERPTLSMKMLADAPSYKIATGEDPEALIDSKTLAAADAMLKALSKLEGLDLLGNSSAHREAAKQYLEAILAIGRSDSK